MMHVYTIILPSPFGQREPKRGNLSRAIAALRDGVLKVAGGFTVTYGDGAWRDPVGNAVEEPVQVFTVAAPATEAVNFVLRELARDAGAIGRQAAVYFAGLHGAELLPVLADAAVA